MFRVIGLNCGDRREHTVVIDDDVPSPAIEEVIEFPAALSQPFRKRRLQWIEWFHQKVASSSTLVLKNGHQLVDFSDLASSKLDQF